MIYESDYEQSISDFEVLLMRLQQQFDTTPSYQTGRSYEDIDEIFFEEIVMTDDESCYTEETIEEIEDTQNLTAPDADALGDIGSNPNQSIGIEQTQTKFIEIQNLPQHISCSSDREGKKAEEALAPTDQSVTLDLSAPSKPKSRKEKKKSGKSSSSSSKKNKTKKSKKKDSSKKEKKPSPEKSRSKKKLRKNDSKKKAELTADSDEWSTRKIGKHKKRSSKSKSKSKKRSSETKSKTKEALCSCKTTAVVDHPPIQGAYSIGEERCFGSDEATGLEKANAKHDLSGITMSNTNSKLSLDNSMENMNVKVLDMSDVPTSPATVSTSCSTVDTPPVVNKNSHPKRASTKSKKRISLQKMFATMDKPSKKNSRKSRRTTTAHVPPSAKS
ncbi:MAG: hypothetical protein SGBAC_008729 [Bacillariaceae sp.]